LGIIFHIIPQAAWQAAKEKGSYEPSSLAKQGFIHFSLAKQICAVADFNYRGATDLLLLEIDEALVSHEMKYEDLWNEGQDYPHLYGPLDVNAVVHVHTFPSQVDGTFKLPMTFEERAVILRKENRPEEALVLLTAILDSHPGDANLNYQIARTHDFMGKESQAVFNYEEALKQGITEDRQGVYLGLGSTYRCLGEYEKSLQAFDKGLEEFPDDRALKVFRALTLFNLGRSEESIEVLLIQLLETTVDEDIKAYEGALRFYSDKLYQTWLQ
jgi:uncharacterized protein (DUF952 family)